MKHILNNLTEEEKNSIREQHTGGMKVMTENFSKLLNSKLGDSKPLVNEQVKTPQKTKISGDANQFLKNNSSELNKSLGIPRSSLNSCFKYFYDVNAPSTFGVSDDEIKKYVDYLGVYGKVPGTGIPIPYQGDDLNQMKYFLWGNERVTNGMAYGSVGQRTHEIDGVVYPAVEVIRSMYTKKKGKSLSSSLQKSITDSQEDLERKKEIENILLDAYKIWIDCANGRRDSSFN